MKPFWKGFTTSKDKHVTGDRYVLVLYWDKNNKDTLNLVNRVRLRHPIVKIKTVERCKGCGNQEWPTVLLLKNGEEAARLEGNSARSPTLISNIFQEAYK